VTRPCEFCFTFLCLIVNLTSPRIGFSLAPFSFVGITADVLLAKKKNRELLEPYEVRKGCVEDFIRAMNPNLKVSIGTLP